MASPKVNKQGPASVYIITSDTVKAVYYGSTQQPLDRRFEDHTSSLKYDRHFNHQLQFLYNAGVRDWKIELVEQVASIEEAKELEIELARSNTFSMNILGKRRRKSYKENTVTAQIVTDVKQWKDVGMKQYEIAKRVGLSGCTVSYIARGYYDDVLEAA